MSHTVDSTAYNHTADGTVIDRTNLAQQQILGSAGVESAHLEKALAELMSLNIDYADLYFQRSRLESWSLEDGIVKDGSFSQDQGVGVRAVKEDKSGFAYADEIAVPALTQAASAAGAIAHRGDQQSVAQLQPKNGRALYRTDDPVPSVSDKEKIALLEHADKVGRAADPRVKRVMANIVSAYDEILVASTDGVLAGDLRPMVRMNVTVLVEQDGRVEQGSAGGGGRLHLGYFSQKDMAAEYAKEAVRQALVNLEAVPAPAGQMTVVLGPGWPGVMIHEAVGHGLEGDFNRKGTSMYAGRMGEQVASELCTIVDDGTIADRRGSLNIDDEGVETRCTTLIENGKLVGYMQDKMNARLMGTESTGNGRRESFAHLPMPRMTNTYMLAGESEPEEILASVKDGLYAVNFGGGQVDITSGKFVFSASEAYMIRDGKVCEPVKGATLIGDGPTALTQVSMVGNDLELDTGVGVCGKDGQSVPVGVGQPTLKMDSLTVGGTQS